MITIRPGVNTLVTRKRSRAKCSQPGSREIAIPGGERGAANQSGDITGAARFVRS